MYTVREDKRTKEETRKREESKETIFFAGSCLGKSWAEPFSQLNTDGHNHQMMLYIIQTLPKHATRPKKPIPPVLPRTYEQEWRNWECTKNEFQNMYVPEEIF